MKKTVLFFVKLIAAAMLFFCFAFLAVLPQYTGNYQASMVDKVNRLESIEGAKIVLLGNSNLAFGMNSAMVEENFRMPVVNMGLHGGVGNAFNESVARLNVHEGDIYVIFHDNFSDNDCIKNPELAWITIENHYELWGLLRMKDIPGMARAFPTYLHKCIDMWGSQTGNAEETNAYRRSAFNEYGDNIYPRPAGEGEVDFSPVRINPISDVAAERINRLNSYLTERGAILVVAGYPVAEAETTPKREEYENFQSDLQEKLDCPVISDYNDYRMDKSYFYDSYLHMTDAGVSLRTNLFINDLRTYLNGAVQ